MTKLTRPTSPWLIEQNGIIPVPEEMIGRTVDLVHIDDVDNLNDGTILFSIFGQKAVVGKDEIDTDNRSGYIAWGFLRQYGTEAKAEGSKNGL